VALKIRKHPLVVQNNGESTVLYKVKISKGLKKLFYLFQLPFEKMSFKNIDLLYLLDERLKKYLPVSDAMVKQQTLGVMPERFIPLNKKEARKLLNLDPDKNYLLYVGKLNYTKRPDILIDIYKEINEIRKDIELLIVGTNEEDPLINYAKTAGATIQGRIIHTDMYKYLSAADVYILPKYSVEHIFGGIGLLPIEALLCNTPIIGGSLENFPKEVRESVGFVASEKEEMKDAILKIIDRRVVFNNLRETAIKYYAWEKIIANTSEDFNKLIDRYFNLKE
jgi:glycosyltransferase involved in cell wall biosynthesis